MSKRKQMRPSKFDFGKKGDDQSEEPSGERSSNNDELIDQNCDDNETHERTPEFNSETESVANICETVAAVARTTSSSGVIVQPISRKRAASAVFDSDLAGKIHSAISIEAKYIKRETGSDEMESLSSDDQCGRRMVERDVGKRKWNSVQRRSRIDTPRENSLRLSSSDTQDNIQQPQRRQPVKSFVCPFCGTGFSNPTTLEAHRTIYCTRKPADPKAKQHAATTMSTSHLSPVRMDASVRVANIPTGRVALQRSGNHTAHPSNPVSNSNQWDSNLAHPPKLLGTSDMSMLMSVAPAVILLPCGFSRSNSIQVIGKPQTVVPVAVPRSFSPSDFAVTPLRLEESWCHDVDILDCDLPLGESSPKEPNVSPASSSSPRKAFSLPLSVQPVGGEKAKFRGVATNATIPSRSSDEFERKTENGHCRERSPPLDLTTRTSRPESPPSVNAVLKASSMLDPSGASLQQLASPTSSSAIHPKNYACPKCGVAFSSRKTLEGHQLYYCKGTATMVSSSATSSKPQKDQFTFRSSPQTLSCQYCDHTATTPWLLVHHMKNIHGLGSAYLCLLCSYRGFSMRGLKSHLKHAHADDPKISAASDDEGLLLKYVRKTKLFDDPAVYDDDDDVESRSSGSPSDLDVGDRESSKDGEKTPSPPLEKSAMKRDPRKDNHEHTRSSLDGHCSVETAQQSTLPSKYACQFCAYKSPYKGNVKRHLSLVHKVEKEKASK